MRRKIPPTSALLCFEAAARAGSFAGGAREMNLSQSAFSRQIQSLEALTGQTLFKRERQRVQLSGAGRMLQEELAPQLEALEATFYRLRTRDNPYGALNIGTYPTLGSRWLMPRLATLAQAQPRLTINTITYLDNSQVDPSLVDLAIVQGDPPWPGFRADLLMPETLIAVAAPDLLDGPLPSAAGLLEFPALQHSTRPLSWQIWFEDQTGSLTPRPTGPLFSQFEMLIDAVKYGHGVAILPELLVRRDLSEGTLIQAHPHRCTPASAYYLLTPQAKTGTSRIERVRDWLLRDACSPSAG
ncbi:LysR family transcriptional regulator [Leisingera sp. HS039]|uniref:LysR substrate-binding domain-containing protein n=1 Tax=unclassified Leisingera TaxID=2614906 RepID=UPI0010708D7D|nr:MULTISPECIES: LysR substrate-binding domain-containing protein [unclassified Leisingera]MBQ4826183.1 LysR family transcriptional regulator [Leisingera sp. HS039]QBR37536.1 LysR family transcriptional regulator [Leisingera sp. NJS201]